MYRIVCPRAFQVISLDPHKILNASLLLVSAVSAVSWETSCMTTYLDFECKLEGFLRHIFHSGRLRPEVPATLPDDASLRNACEYWLATAINVDISLSAYDTTQLCSQVLPTVEKTWSDSYKILLQCQDKEAVYPYLQCRREFSATLDLQGLLQICLQLRSKRPVVASSNGKNSNA